MDIHLLNLLGTKWKNNMISTNRSLMFANKYTYIIDLFGGGLGLTMNITSQFKHLIINDFDVRKANLFLCLKNDPIRLICEILRFQYTEENFNIMKDQKYTVEKMILIVISTIFLRQFDFFFLVHSVICLIVNLFIKANRDFQN